MEITVSGFSRVQAFFTHPWIFVHAHSHCSLASSVGDRSFRHPASDVHLSSHAVSSHFTTWQTPPTLPGALPHHCNNHSPLAASSIATVNAMSLFAEARYKHAPEWIWSRNSLMRQCLTQTGSKLLQYINIIKCIIIYQISLKQLLLSPHSLAIPSFIGPSSSLYINLEWKYIVIILSCRYGSKEQ